MPAWSGTSCCQWTAWSRPPGSSPYAVIGGLVYGYLIFMILPIYASLERVDARLVEAAGDLYANGLTTLRKVTIPLSLPGVVAGTLLTFIPAFGDYVNATVLGSSNQAMIGNKIQSLYLVERNYPEAAALSFMMMGLILIIVFASVRGLFAFLQAYWAEKNSQSVAYDFRNELYSKIQTLSFSYHDRNQTGQLMICATSNVDQSRPASSTVSRTAPAPRSRCIIAANGNRSPKTDLAT